MRLRHQDIGHIHKSPLTTMTQKTLYFSDISMFYNMRYAVIRAIRPVGCLPVRGNNAEYKTDNPIYVGFAKAFDVVK